MPFEDIASTLFLALGRHAGSHRSSASRLTVVAYLLFVLLLSAFRTSVGRAEQVPESGEAVGFRPVSAAGKIPKVDAAFRRRSNNNTERGTEPAVLHAIVRLPMAPQEEFPIAMPHGTIGDAVDGYQGERPRSNEAQSKDGNLEGDGQADLGDAGRWSPRPVTALGVDIGLPAGPLPREYSPPRDRITAWPWDAAANARGWPQLSYCWCATGLCYNPLYFEEVNLERYGYGCCHCLQPAVSAAHFFVRVPALPYLMAVDCPSECNYTLGHYRPGNCNPWRCHYPPCTFKGGLSAAGAATALVFILP